jgi:hypothetical protein
MRVLVLCFSIAVLGLTGCEHIQPLLDAANMEVDVKVDGLKVSGGAGTEGVKVGFDAAGLVHTTGLDFSEVLCWGVGHIPVLGTNSIVQDRCEPESP